MSVCVHEGNIQDRDGARLLLEPLKGRYPSIELLWCDSAYRGRCKAWVEEELGWRVEVIQGPKGGGFQVQPRRWVVERTFGWLGRYRALSKDYERLPAVSQSLIYLAMIRTLVRRQTEGMIRHGYKEAT